MKEEANGIAGRSPFPADVTVVIPTRDRLGYLKSAVESVLRQEGPTVRCLVVDDGSTDGTPTWLRDRCQEGLLEAITLPASTERSAARNAGLAATRSEFVHFLDDDDLLASGAIRALVECLELHPESVVAIGRQVQFTDDGRRWLEKHPRPRRPADLRRSAMYGPVFPPGQCLLRAEAVRQVGGWDPRFEGPEDQDLLLRIAEVGRGCFVPRVTYLKRVHSGNLGVGDDSEPAERMRLEHVARLGFSVRGRAAMRWLEARRSLRQSHHAYRGGHGAEALLAACRSVLLDPGMLTDPVSRGGVIGYLGRCLVRSVPGSYRVASALGFTSRNGPA